MRNTRRSPLQHRFAPTARFLCSLVFACLMTTACSKPKPEAHTPAIPVQVTTLDSGKLQDSTVFVGTLSAEQAVELKPQIEGRIVDILVQPGDRVEKGQPLFTLSPDQTVPQYNSASAAVNAAIAARKTALQEVEVARAQETTAKAQYDNAQVNADRARYLLSQGAIGAYRADNAFTEAVAAKEAYAAAQKQVVAAQAKVAEAGAQIRQQQANAASSAVSVDFKQVLAPIPGFVGDINLKPGDYVNTGYSLTTLTDNDAFDLKIPMPLSRTNQLRTGLPVQLLDPTTGDQLATGSIYFIDAQTDPEAQSIMTRARFTNNGKLRNSQYVRARVIWNTSAGLLVPTTAVTTIGAQSFVFVAESKPESTASSTKSSTPSNTTSSDQPQLIARQIPITVGNIQGNDYQVLNGLKPGQKVITEGVLRLRDGVPIRVQNASASHAPATSEASPQS